MPRKLRMYMPKGYSRKGYKPKKVEAVPEVHDSSNELDSAEVQTDMVDVEVQTDTAVDTDEVDAIVHINRLQLLNEETEKGDKHQQSDREEMVDAEEQAVEMNDVTKYRETDHEVLCDTVETVNTEEDNVNTEVDYVEALNTEDDSIEMVNTEVDYVEAMNSEIDNVETMNTEVDNVETISTEVDNVETVNSEIDNVETMNTDVDNVETMSTEVDNVETVNTEVDNVETMITEVDNVEMMNTEINNVETMNTEVQPSEQFRNAKICEGNSKFHPLITKNKGIFKDPSGKKVVAYYDQRFATIRHVNCPFYLPKTVTMLSTRCSVCTSYRENVLRNSLNRLLKQSDDDSRIEADSRVNFRYLNTPQKLGRLQNLSRVVRTKERKIQELHTKLLKTTNSFGVRVNEGVHKDLVSIMNLHKEQHPTNAENFESIFWNQQLKAATLKSTRQMRWRYIFQYKLLFVCLVNLV